MKKIAVFSARENNLNKTQCVQNIKLNSIGLRKCSKPSMNLMLTIFQNGAFGVDFGIFGPKNEHAKKPSGNFGQLDPPETSDQG